MPKKVYVGIGDKAKQVKKIYLGVDDKARNVKKGYVGVNGIARQFWPNEDLPIKTNTTLTLQQGRAWMGTTTLGEYAVFGGGLGFFNESSNSWIFAPSTKIDAFDKNFAQYSLTTETGSVPALINIKDNALTIGDYALFGANGSSHTNQSKPITVYNNSLSRLSPIELSSQRYDVASTTIGNYALFGGGNGSSESSGVISNIVDAYDKNLSHSTPTALAQERSYAAATTIGDYALFGGGTNNGAIDTVEVYDKNLNRTTPISSLVSPSWGGAATTIGGYALFGGGVSDTIGINVVTAYDNNLNRITPTYLSENAYMPMATNTKNHAIFIIGQKASANVSANFTNIIDLYDETLQRHSLKSSISAGGISGITIKDHLLIGGGYYQNRANSTPIYYNKIEVYDI
ncbi:MAG: hypothetical protein NC320_01665 [Clostridium sp.]|nr:hypothetical protein [Clostridium sp.]